MPTNTTNYSFQKPTVSGDSGLWGGYLNGNWDSVDSLLGGGTAITGIDINSGSIDGAAIGANSASTGVFTSVAVDNITINGQQITSTDTNGNIQLFANGTGFIELYGNTNAGAIRFNCESNTHGVTLKGPPHSAAATYSLELPDADGSNGQFLKTDGSGKLSFGSVSATTLADLGVSATAAELNLNDGSIAGTIVNSKTVVYGSAGEVNATTLQLAGTAITSTAAELNLLDGVTATTAELNYVDVTTLGTTEASKAVTADANGVVTFDNGKIEESTVVSSSSGAATLNLRDGDNFTHTLSENVTYTFSNPAASGKVSAFTLKVVQDSTARTITWPASVDWAAATAPTLTATSGGVDVFVFVTYDGGTTYYGFTAGQAMG